jgi:hypothetical protein
MERHLAEEDFWDLAEFIETNPGLTAIEILKDFKSKNEFKFSSEKEFLILMKIIGESPQSFWGIGPFINEKGKWNNVRSKKKEQIEKLTEGNKQLKDQILKLQAEFFKYKKRVP